MKHEYRISFEYRKLKGSYTLDVRDFSFDFPVTVETKDEVESIIISKLSEEVGNNIKRFIILSWSKYE